MRSILLVNEDKIERQGLAVYLRKEIGCVVLETESPEEALALLEKEEISLLITDLFLPEKKGFDLLRKVQKANPEVVSIVGIPENSRDLNVEALKLGAFFHISAPYDFGEAVIAAARGLQYHDLMFYKQKRGAKIRKSEGFHGIVGHSEKMLRLFDIMQKVAEDGLSTVLLQGETGTGKELVARAIHARSPRKAKNFVPVNCAAIPDDLLESELFGYVKGAFTGANQSKIGRVQYADGGTLFLDEIGDMKPALQAKLLRVLQEKEFEPVGGVKPVPVDVRVIAATHRDLEKAVADGVFREDLYYRLSVIPLRIPPLRERREDIALLIEKFVEIFNRNKKETFKGFESEAIAALLGYPWPGNVRELENLVQRMSILLSGKAAGLIDLPAKYAEHVGSNLGCSDLGGASGEGGADIIWTADGIDFNTVVGEFEERLILKALDLADGNKKEAARLLHLNRTTLLEKIKKKNIAFAKDDASVD